MIARLQRILALLLALSALLCLALFAEHKLYFLGLLAAIGVSFVHALIIGAELTMMAVVAGAKRPPLGALLQAWCREVTIAPQVFYWRQPFRSNAHCDLLPVRPDGRPGVLLIHGFLCNRGFWNPWMERLRRENISHLAINLEPAFGSISRLSQQIEDAVTLLATMTGTPPIVVAHSMGGLAARFWLHERSGDCRVERIISIGTPHQGTWLARFGRSESVREMAVDGDWLRSLSMSSSAARNALFTCYYSDCDNAVFPSERATLEGADNRLCRGAGHVDLAFRTNVIDKAIECVLQPRRNHDASGAAGRSDASHKIERCGRGKV